MAMRTLRAPEPDPAEDALAFIGGLLAGALIGGLIAIFLAPSDGQSLRRRFKAQLGLESDGASEGASSGPAASTGSTGSNDPLLAPGNVAREEGVAEQRLPAYSH
jgi:hypothetical protein